MVSEHLRAAIRFLEPPIGCKYASRGAAHVVQMTTRIFGQLLREDPLLTEEDAVRTHSKLAGLKG